MFQLIANVILVIVMNLTPFVVVEKILGGFLSDYLQT
jgi:hypothetical protein